MIDTFVLNWKITEFRTLLNNKISLIKKNFQRTLPYSKCKIAIKILFKMVYKDHKF